MGWIADHKPLQQELLQACRQHEAVEMHIGAGSSPSPNPDDLQVIAEGANSSSRQALGIGFRGFRYRQSCLTVQVRFQTACGDDGTAWELFRPEGPLAVLPFGAGVAQVVWSAPQQRCQERCELHPEAFLAALNDALPPAAQAEALLDQPAWFPVEWRLALAWAEAPPCSAVNQRTAAIRWGAKASISAGAMWPPWRSWHGNQSLGPANWCGAMAAGAGWI